VTAAFTRTDHVETEGFLVRAIEHGDKFPLDDFDLADTAKALIVETLESLSLTYPEVSPAKKKELAMVRKSLSARHTA
jgi:hypothetical protein